MIGILFIGQTYRSCKCCDVIWDPLHSDDGKSLLGYVYGEFGALALYWVAL